ncbi:phospho-N-acetylmuramoyl-pentapeptide-transferase [Nitrosophilus labii]|uniref:phospho-N-acetylmuramoyl-pentapeptide- transferase n=1 Tax=Nitrosophilus labii TaxID=2706014 RepID=UPI0016572F2C|nr:phospho-N-acetylmuramoyl-pentapeptide-transferase [Nitrosophilus labii]
MLYLLYKHFDINLFQYITVRAGFGFFIAFILTLWLMPRFIKWARTKNANQPIYSLAPQTHKNKANTPTMGGVVFIFSTIVASLLTAKIDNIFVVCALLTIVLFTIIGIKDDISKIVKKENQSGLSAKAKVLLQIAASLIIASILYFYSNLSSELYIPFYKYPIFDMGFFAILFWVLVMVATSNAVNLTDGLDGLATVPSIFSLASLSLLVYITGHAGLSSYLLLPKVTGVGEVTIIGAALAGALIGFLWYNCHPAEVFMGDSGSLSIGALLAYLSIVSKSELLLIIIGFVFVLEALSVILQVGSYKLRGKRVFLMAPIHHHFEQKNWKESKIIVRFWIIALISNIIALITLKIR